MIHQGQRLPFGLESRHHLGGIHSRLDDLESNGAANRLELLCHPDGAHAAFADRLQELVGPDPCPRSFGGRRRLGRGGGSMRYGLGGGRIVQEAADLAARRQQRFDLSPQGVVAGAMLVEKTTSLRRRRELGGLQEKFIRYGVPFCHGMQHLGGAFWFGLSSVRQIRASCTGQAKIYFSESTRAWNSQVRARSQTRSAARRLSPSAWAACWCSNPAK